jgi:putative endonuclease
MFFTYIIVSETKPGIRYIGHAVDVEKRLQEHNAGKSPHTAKSRPWKLKLYVAFEDLEHATSFERYLKSGSGHEFAKRHFW